MMETHVAGTSCSWVAAADLEPRIDSFFYSPDSLRDTEWLRRYGRRTAELSDLASMVTDGVHKTPNYVEAGVPFLTATNIDPLFLNLRKGFKRTSRNEFDEFKRANCVPIAGDVVIGKSGKIGTSAVVPESLEFSCLHSIAIIRPCELMDSHFLSAYLNSEYAESQIRRCQKGAVQPMLHLEEIESLRIPNCEIELQQAIGHKARKVSHLQALAYDAIDRATSKMCSHFGISYDGHMPKPETKWARALDINERLDAWYYRPTFDAIDVTLDRLSEDGIVVNRLRNLASVEYGYMPTEDYKTPVDGVPFFRTTNFDDVLGYKLDDVKYVNPDASANPKHCINEGDVLVIQCGNNTGKVCYVGESIDGWAYPSFALRVRAIQKYDSGYLSLVLNSPIGQLQIEKDISITSVRPNTTKPALLNLRIPLLSEDLQAELGRMVRLATKLRSQVKPLLDEVFDDLEKVLSGNTSTDTLIREGLDAARWIEENPISTSTEKKE